MKTIATNAIWELMIKDSDTRVVKLKSYDGTLVDAIILMCEKILCDSGIDMLSKLTEIIKSFPKSVPCWLIGIGSNIKNRNFHNYVSIKRDKAIREFIDEVLSRSKSIGVRGELNKEWLVEYFGYDEVNVDVILNEEDTYDKKKLHNFIRKNGVTVNFFEAQCMMFQRKKRICYDFLSVKDHHREIRIKNAYITDEVDGKIRLHRKIEIDGEEKDLWLETDESMKSFLETELIDPFVIGLLPFSMRTEHDLYSDFPISEELLHNINELLIPNLCGGDKRLWRTKICAPVEPYENMGKEVGIGFSCGVDSFYSLQHYSQSPYSIYKPTYLYCGNYVYTSSMNQIYDRVEKVSEEGEIGLIKTNTNISEAFPGLTHLYVHFYKTIFGVMCLRRFFKAYIYSTTYNATHFSLENNATKDCAYYELLLIDSVSTDGFRLIDGGCDVDRVDKTRELIKYPLSYNHLNVCLNPGLRINCGTCGKCLRTLLTLDALDGLELYRESFDIKEYKKNRNNHLRYLKTNRAKEFFKDIYLEFNSKNPELMRNL